MNKFLVVASLLVLSACGGVTSKVEQLAITGMKEVCLRENPRVARKDFLPRLKTLFEKHNVKATTYTGQLPRNCRFHGDYTANWAWDVATYLSYAEIRLFEGDRQIGLVEFDARKGLLDKFGSVESRLEPLFARLFSNN